MKTAPKSEWRVESQLFRERERMRIFLPRFFQFPFRSSDVSGDGISIQYKSRMSKLMDKSLILRDKFRKEKGPPYQGGGRHKPKKGQFSDPGGNDRLPASLVAGRSLLAHAPFGADYAKRSSKGSRSTTDISLPKDLLYYL